MPLVPASPQENSKRLRLRVATKLMFGFGLLVFVALLLSSLSGPSSTPKALPSMLVETSRIKEGEVEYKLWHGRPVLILHRSSAQINTLGSASQALRDPNSNQSTQPDFALAQTAQRSRGQQWFVAFSSGTHQGCPIELYPAGGEFLDEPWLGGFRDTCAGSVYDFAGRVFAEQPARENLSIPMYTIKPNGDILLGGS